MHKQLVISEMKRRLANMTPEEKQAAYLKVKQAQKERNTSETKLYDAENADGSFKSG